MRESAGALIIDVVLLLSLLLLGYQAIRALAPQANRVESLAAAFPLGAGLFTFMAFGMSWAGVELEKASLVASYAALLAIFLLGRRFFPGRLNKDGRESL